MCLVDTPGAYPGIGAEERGQAEAIAYNLKEISKLPIPIVIIVHAEGGSGGALAIAVGDRVFMLQNAIYSVISPESCSSILWHDWEHKREAAQILKLTAQEFEISGSGTRHYFRASSRGSRRLAKNRRFHATCVKGCTRTTLCSQ